MKYENYPKSPMKYEDYPKSPMKYENYPKSPMKYENYTKSLMKYENYPKSPMNEILLFGVRWKILQFQSLLERLEDGVVIGDGGYVFQLERRGYVLAGRYTPEAVLERPHAGIQANLNLRVNYFLMLLLKAYIFITWTNTS